MRVKRKKDQKVYSYSGDLREEIEKAKAEYEKKKDAQERIFLLWQFQKAKKAHEAYEQRIADLKGFIELAEETLKEQESGNNA